jgi:two-component system, cell cycle sensor histidine kinase and response regulator CckA
MVKPMKRILVVDDNQENRYLLEVLFKAHGYETISAENGAKALDVASRYLPDLVIADILMPVMDGYRLCREWKRDSVLKRIPFIFYTATYTDPEDREFALGLGAERFVIKPQDPAVLAGIVSEVLHQQHTGGGSPPKTDDEFLRNHNRVLSRKLEKKTKDVERLHRDLSVEITERRRLEEKVAACESRFNEILDSAPMAMTFMDRAGEMLYVNREFVNLFGYRLEDLPDADALFSAAYPDDGVRRSMMHVWENAPTANGRPNPQIKPVEARIRCKDGGYKDVSVLEVSISEIHLTAYHDITEQRLLASQLIQAQRMEVLGHFAGGLAHDFNNILMAISGYGQLLMATLPEEESSRRYVEKILSTTGRGEKLTHGLFSFGRKQQIEEKPIALNRVVIEAVDMLKQLVRKGIELRTDLCAREAVIVADPNQIEQILMNLVKNASDAIEGAGTITIGTEKVALTDEGHGSRDVCAGDPHVLLTVTDNGQGISEEMRKNIFEPFFTSKEKGKGTGLGLSVVHGIVQRHKGHIDVDTTPGKGTRFSIYFPAPARRDDRETGDDTGKDF